MSLIEISHRKMRLIGSDINKLQYNINKAVCNSGECIEMFDKKLAKKEAFLTEELNRTNNAIRTIKERIATLEIESSIPSPSSSPTPTVYVDEVPPQPEGDILYVIIPYFNYCLFKRRIQLFTDFVNRYADTKGIRIVVAEGVIIGEECQLPDFGSKVFMHVKINLQDRIWIKENLINLAIKRIPNDWKYISWIDADITFLNTNWDKDTLKLLETNDIVQLFHSAVNMGPDGESTKVEQGFVYMHKHSGKKFNRTSRYGVWHPGFAWACTRKTYETIGGLLEIAILGSADRHTALSLIGLADVSYPGNIGLSYQYKVLELQERCKGLQFDYVKGTILHHFHGSIANRRYVDRWNILTKNLYNVKNDIYYNEEGVVCLTEKGKRMQSQIDEYFFGRDEDATSI